MSVHPTPPASTVGQRSRPVGFNDQTSYDPFFPSSPSDEHLVPIESSLSPSSYSYHSQSPPQACITSGGGPQIAALNTNAYDTLQIPSQSTLTNGFQSSQSSHTDVDHEAAGTAYDLLSPNAYMSDNGYNASSEYTATPDFGGTNGFYPEDDYGLLIDSNQNIDLNEHDYLTNGHLQQTYTYNENLQHSRNSRHSTGTATLSSHLMSPVLTNSAGPSSRHGTNSPPEGGKSIKSEGLERVPTTVLLHNANQGKMDPTFGVQITPTRTESSKGTSPDLSSGVPNIARAISPVIRVDGYSRGDSPARGATLLPQSGNKRNRAGSNASHLSVQQDDESEGEDGNDYFQDTQGSNEQIPARTGINPEQRTQISDAEIPNLKEQESADQVELKNIDVREWLDRSDDGNAEKPDARPQRPAPLSRRQRAKSAGAHVLSHENLESFEATIGDSHIPGPGLLINEESGDEDDDDEYEEDEKASIEDSPPPTTALGEFVNDIPGEAKPGVYDELPNQPLLYRAKLWQDPLHDSSDPGIKLQPDTANAAITRFQQRAGDIETLSRVATWGTRRLSESDLHSLFHNLSFNEKTQVQGQAKEKRERRGSFLQQLSGKLNRKRSNTNLKRQDSDKSTKSKEKPVQPSPLDHARKDSTTSQGSRRESLGVPQATQSGLKRMSSLGKRPPKSPRINTGSAIAAMTVQAGALGAGGSVSATATSSPTDWPKNKMRAPRNCSNINDLGQASSSTTDLGLVKMWSNHLGGPPLPTLAAPLKTEESLTVPGGDEDDDEDEGLEDHGVTMDLSIRSDLIVPTLEGFKANIRQLNPRLPPFMFDRIAREQLLRFKKLVDFKIKHAQALSLRKCASGKHCTELGGEPTYLPTKSNIKEPELRHTGFTVTGLGQSDEDANALAEGLVTPAQFPPGVPMPPVKRLPAEFECSLCFKVKKFHKPSDWSKHVHEDVQPFTCTFDTCAEPKSFKRKADWVRHENERHRQLEWWMCNMSDCSHKCYRKDNFVQHLVREHKLPEPKVKTMKSGKPAVRGPSSHKARSKLADDTEDFNDEIDQVWRLVEECRHETPKSPKDEACKFCGNICNSWKKLTVHLAKHMEQISMPVLGIVRQKEVTPETIISPIEQRITSQQPSMSPIAQSPFSQPGHPTSTSPYGMSVGAVNELPGAFTAFQSQTNYFGAMPSDNQSPHYQRASPNTYPPPGHSQQLAAGYNQNCGPNAYISNLNPYTASSPASQFTPVNNNRGYQQPQTPISDNTYSGGFRTPTSQPRTVAYDDGSGFQFGSQQQQAFSSPVEGGAYPISNPTPTSYPQQQTLPPTSYPMQQPIQTPSSYSAQPTSMDGQMPLPYQQMGHLGQTQSYGQANGVAPLYNQQQQQHPQAYGYGQ